MNYPSHKKLNDTLCNTHWLKYIPVISTSHITKEDGEFISRPGHHPGIMDEDKEWSLVKTSMKYWKASKVSSYFLELLDQLASLGYRWIILDRDGDVLKDLPTFEW